MFKNACVIKNKATIFVCSEEDMNEWMDCVFIVDEKNADKAVEILNEAFANWFDSDTSEAFGDWLEDALSNNGIEFDSYYKC